MAERFFVFLHVWRRFNTLDIHIFVFQVLRLCDGLLMTLMR